MIISNRINNIMSRVAHIDDFFTNSLWAQNKDDPSICDFVLGNPHEPVVPGLVDALQEWSTPQNKDWFAYKQNETKSRRHVAETLREWRGLPFETNDIFLTNGAFAAISVTLKAFLNPDDEVIFVSPPWFFYESLIADAGGVPVRVKCDPETFDLDVNAIENAITDKTKAVIINTPNNPTGRIYPAETLKDLASMLTEASDRIGHPICLLSDEAYSRIIYDDNVFVSPTEFYPYTFLIYTYTKTLLAPGQRIAYIALAPDIPDKESIRSALNTSQIVTGFAYPNALLQHALPDIEPLSIDVQHYQHKRDRLVRALREMGYEVNLPEGTFYLLVCSPIDNEDAFLQQLADEHVYCLPGEMIEMPGYFRISLTASVEMIEQALPTFQRVVSELV